MALQAPLTHNAGQIRLQVHPDKAPSLDVPRLKTKCSTLATQTAGVLGFSYEEGEDNGKYLNLVFDSQAPLAVWPDIQATLYDSFIFGAALRSASMALCTGKDGWNDYRLLYHFDPNVPIDSVSEVNP